MKVLSYLLMLLGALSFIGGVTFLGVVIIEHLAEKYDPQPASELACPDEIEPVAEWTEADLDAMECEEMWARPSSFYDQRDGEMRSW